MAIIVDLAGARRIKANSIKNDAQEVVNQYYPQYIQTNMLARSAQLLEKKADGIALTIDEINERQLLIDAKAWIDSVRNESKTKAALVATAMTVDEVNAITPDWPINPPRWTVY